MAKTFQRILSFLMAVVMCVSMLPTSALAAEADIGEDAQPTQEVTETSAETTEAPAEGTEESSETEFPIEESEETEAAAESGVAEESEPAEGMEAPVEDPEEETEAPVEEPSQAPEGAVEIDAAHFPDDTFRAYVKNNFDKDADGMLSAEEISSVVIINVDNTHIQSLSGVEYFLNLKKLLCETYELTELDIRQNTALEYLDCAWNKIESLDISCNPKLTELYAHENKITALDVSQNPELVTLYCRGNEITALDISNNLKLTRLDCGGNKFTSLDFTANQELTELYCDGGNLTSLDFSANVKLRWISCSGIPMDSLELSKNINLIYLNCSYCKLTELDISHNPSLQTLNCGNNQLAALNTQNNPALESIVCERNQIAALDLSNNTKLRALSCYENPLGTLDLSHNTELDRLICTYNALTELNLGQSNNLTWLECYGNQLSSLELSNNTKLNYLNCSINQLSELDLSGNPLLRELRCGYNQLRDLDLSNNPELAYLYCRDNLLETLNVDGCSALTVLHCYNNQLSELTANAHPALRELHCFDNQLTSLDVSNATSLEDLRAGDNKLTKIDVSNDTTLRNLELFNNYLTDLDIEDQQALKTLSCYNNNLNALDCSNCPMLEHINFAANQITEINLSENPGVISLNCSSNHLLELNIQHSPHLQKLICADNQVSALDISKNVELVELNCGTNNLKELDISKNTALESLSCDYNQISELNVRNNTELHTLYCQSNKLSELDVSQNSKLGTLSCGSNFLTELDVSNNTLLRTLWCQFNQFTELDVRNNTQLESLWCEYNQLAFLDISNNPVLYDADIYPQRYPVSIVSGQTIDLRTVLPESFDFSKASNWRGGTVEGTMLTVDPGVSEISYTYDCGNGRLADFSIGDHMHMYRTTVTVSTCTDQGFTIYVCTCGDSYIDNYMEALGHDWDDGVIISQPTEYTDAIKTHTCLRCGKTKTEVIHEQASAVVTEPSCTEQGYTTYTCAKCGEDYVEDYVPALGHDWDDGVITTQPTEDAEGVKTFTCNRCGSTRTEMVPKLDHVHSYTSEETLPTCTSRGYTIHICKCGDSYIDDYVDALGHDEVADAAVEATCTTPGKTAGSNCNRCGEVLVVQEETPALGHDWDEGVITTQPTEETEGEKTFTCNRCGTTKTESVPKLNHVHSYIGEETAPTCTSRGYITYTCICGDSYISSYLDALGHDEVVDTAIEATCTTPGKTAGSHCDRCGEVLAIQEEIPALGHDEVVDAAEEATCTTPGKTEGGHCNRCGEVLAVQEEMDALGHAAVVAGTQSPTCTEDGYSGDEICMRCEEITTAGEILPALGHNGVSVTIPEAAPTDTAPGNVEFVVVACTRCGIWMSEDGQPLTQEEIDEMWERHAIYPMPREIIFSLNGQEITGKVEWDVASQGESLMLVPSFAPSIARPNLTWSTSSKTIATVENGTVTFLKPGTVKITAKATDGSGVKAVAEFKVIYRDAATKFTSKLAPETNLYGSPSKSGVQVGDSVNIQVFGTDKEVPLTGLTYEITSGKDYAEIEGNTLTALVAGKTVKVKAFYEGDPLKRSVTVSVKTIATKPGELNLTYGVDADLDEYGYILSDGMDGDTLLVKSGEAKTFDLDLSALDQAGEPLEDFGSITWTSSSTKIATVKNGAVTIKKGVSGTVTITAKSKLDTKVLAKLTIDVVDYTPDVEKSTLTINTYLEGSYPLGIVAEEADPVTDVLFVDKNGEEIDKFAIEEIDGVWSIADPGQILKNASTKGKLILTTLHGQEEEITFTAKISNRAPTITVKTTKKLNTKDPNGYAELTVTSKQGAIADIGLESLTFDYSGEDGIYTLTPQTDVKLDKSGKITVWVEGYRYEVTKSLSVSTESVSNKAVLGAKTLTLDLSEGNAASTTLTSYFVDVAIEDATITTTNAQGKKLIVTFADGIITAAFGNELPKAGSYKFTIKATADDGTALKAVTLTVKVVK